MYIHLMSTVVSLKIPVFYALARLGLQRILSANLICLLGRILLFLLQKKWNHQTQN